MFPSFHSGSGMELLSSVSINPVLETSGRRVPASLFLGPHDRSHLLMLMYVLLSEASQRCVGLIEREELSKERNKRRGRSSREGDRMKHNNEELGLEWKPLRYCGKCERQMRLQRVDGGLRQQELVVNTKLALRGLDSNCNVEYVPK